MDEQLCGSGHPEGEGSEHKQEPAGRSQHLVDVVDSSPASAPIHPLLLSSPVWSCPVPTDRLQGNRAH